MWVCGCLSVCVRNPSGEKMAQRLRHAFGLAAVIVIAGGLVPQAGKLDALGLGQGLRQRGDDGLQPGRAGAATQQECAGADSREARQGTVRAGSATSSIDLRTPMR